MKSRLALLVSTLLLVLTTASAGQSRDDLPALLDLQKAYRRQIADDKANLAKIVKGYTLLQDKEMHMVLVSPDELDTLQTVDSLDYPHLSQQIRRWKEKKANAVKHLQADIQDNKGKLKALDADIQRMEKQGGKSLTLKKVDVSGATEGDPKSWHYPKSVAHDVSASFDYPGLPTPTFTVTAPDSISASSGGVLHLSVDLNGSGRASGDAHINLWAKGLKFDGPDVLEVKVDAGKSASVSRNYTLKLTNPQAREVSFEVGLTWGGPKYKFTYRRS